MSNDSTINSTNESTTNISNTEKSIDNISGIISNNLDMCGNYKTCYSVTIILAIFMLFIILPVYYSNYFFELNKNEIVMLNKNNLTVSQYFFEENNFKYCLTDATTQYYCTKRQGNLDLNVNDILLRKYKNIYLDDYQNYSHIHFVLILVIIIYSICLLLTFYNFIIIYYVKKEKNNIIDTILTECNNNNEFITMIESSIAEIKQIKCQKKYDTNFYTSTDKYYYDNKLYGILNSLREDNYGLIIFILIFTTFSFVLCLIFINGFTTNQIYDCSVDIAINKSLTFTQDNGRIYLYDLLIQIDSNEPYKKQIKSYDDIPAHMNYVTKCENNKIFDRKNIYIPLPKFKLFVIFNHFLIYYFSYKIYELIITHEQINDVISAAKLNKMGKFV